jgi:hypothetical protein
MGEVPRFGRIGLFAGVKFLLNKVPRLARNDGQVGGGLKNTRLLASLEVEVQIRVIKNKKARFSAGINKLYLSC